MEEYELCNECTCTDIDNCKACANYQFQRYKEANHFAEKVAYINLGLIWACLALITALIGVLL